ncbi:rhodanese domain-containing protein CG4456-like isoform X2 [Sipha flava]|uniref:Rhodanese domain-containing protein CG4456-like isoform X2 n=1 Tax=Sipha flava TaxID=143950 RepID=A0A8B8FZC7_9HEMI|nr:rhodanese domain-containing protein CG4456-like isoform X2 [Sipha flava]
MSVYENVDYDGLLVKMDRKSFVIDVRENHELAATGSIPNIGELENELNLPANVFKDKYKLSKPEKENDEIVFSCARGNRSRRAAEIAFKLNYKKLFNYTGGWAEWSVKYPRS